MSSRDSNNVAPRQGIWMRLLCSGASTARDRRNQYRFLIWAALWALVFVASGLTQRYVELDGAPLWLVAFAPTLPAILVVASYLKFLREADELVRRVQMEGLALGFGAGVLLIIAVQLPETTPITQFKGSDVLFVMMLGWAIGQVWATWRYR